ncbi:MAG: type II toxin-antitoxin system RelE/ParE family toxin [Pseudomonadota bacterium]|nr:type II toxin-antitoxin system RelE/ParE family toxin [Pseudomonadota bacterium]
MKRVIWSEAAERDYLGILRHISANDPDAAERVRAAIEKTADNLADFATGHPSRVGGAYEKSVRRLPYIIAYALTDGDKAISILRVIHTARDWQGDSWPE